MLEQNEVINVRLNLKRVKPVGLRDFYLVRRNIGSIKRAYCQAVYCERERERWWNRKRETNKEQEKEETKKRDRKERKEETFLILGFLG